MTFYQLDILSDIDLEMTPLTDDQEGNLRGGFVGIEGGAGTFATNSNCPCQNPICANSCVNDSCNNSDCTNNNCGNSGCINKCTNTLVTSTKQKSIFDLNSSLLF